MSSASSAQPESHQELTLTWPTDARYADAKDAAPPDRFSQRFIPVRITLNGERYEIEKSMSVVELLTRLEIDPRRVAVEHNLAIIKRHTFSDVIVGEGDTVEIVNFVGGG
jgi:thiamine biosynthesis protein ThiS